jgi:hypothetical protein
MRTSWFAAAVVGMTMALGASARVATQERIPLLPRDGWMDPWAVTLVGCVAQGTSAGGYYTLTTSIPQPEATAKDATKSMKLVLTSTEVDLSRHIGHTVSVTGVHAVDWATVTTGTTGREKPVSEGAVKDDDKKTKGTFAVKSLTMVATSCSQRAE